MSLVKKIRLFTIDQMDKEAAYFKTMSEKGLHLVSYSFPFYTFRRGEQKTYQYQTDFQKLDEDNKQSYLQLFQDDGWELVMEYPGVYGSWFYFRKPSVNEEAPVIFTDTQSRIDLYRKIRKNWLIFFLTLSPLFWLSFIVPLLTDTSSFLYSISGILWLIVAVLYAKITINLSRKINKLLK